jgi:hypothetical protein
VPPFSDKKTKIVFLVQTFEIPAIQKTSQIRVVWNFDDLAPFFDQRFQAVTINAAQYVNFLSKSSKS